MRLFIAIPLEPDLRRRLSLLRDAIAGNCPDCRPTRQENLHVTLAFLGELPPEAVETIRACMEAAAHGCFELHIRGLCCFRRKDGDLWWAAVEKSPALLALAASLSALLREKGFSVEDREFSPHLTLVRRLPSSLAPKKETLPLVDARQPVKQIVLYRSERQNGVLCYTPLAEVRL